MMSRALALFLVLTLLAGSLPAADSPNDCSVPSAADLVVNFHRVDAELYRGGRPAYRDDVYLKFADLGIRTVMNLEGGDQAQREKAMIDRVNLRLMKDNKPPLRFVSYPIESFTETIVGAPSQKDMTALFAEIEKAPKPIYLHCQHGKDRTGMVVLLYRVWRGEESFDEAYNEARYYHFSMWNFGLKRTLEHYRAAGTLKSLGAPPNTAFAGVCQPERLKAAATAEAGAKSASVEKH
jgi:tyrosine-protein phosphatase SIW14